MKRVIKKLDRQLEPLESELEDLLNGCHLVYQKIQDHTVTINGHQTDRYYEMAIPDEITMTHVEIRMTALKQCNPNVEFIIQDGKLIAYTFPMSN